MVPADLGWDRIKLGGFLFFFPLFLDLGAGIPSLSLSPPSLSPHLKSSPADGQLGGIIPHLLFLLLLCPALREMRISILTRGTRESTNPTAAHTGKANFMGRALEHYPTFSSH